MNAASPSLSKRAIFTIHDANEQVLAVEEHFDQALRTMKRIHPAECIRRMADDELLATKHRIQGESFLHVLWNTAEPA